MGKRKKTAVRRCQPIGLTRKAFHFYGIRASRFLPCLGPSRCFLVHHLFSHCHCRTSLFGRIKSGTSERRLPSTSMFSRKLERAVRCSVIYKYVLSCCAQPALVPGQLFFRHRRVTLHSRVPSVAICIGCLGCICSSLSRRHSTGVPHGEDIIHATQQQQVKVEDHFVWVHRGAAGGPNSAARLAGPRCRLRPWRRWHYLWGPSMAACRVACPHVSTGTATFGLLALKYWCT